MCIVQRIGIYKSPRRTQPVPDFWVESSREDKDILSPDTNTHSQSPTIPRWRHLLLLAWKITQPDGVWVRHREPVSMKRHRAASVERNKDSDLMLLWMIDDGVEHSNNELHIMATSKRHSNTRRRKLHDFLLLFLKERESISAVNKRAKQPLDRSFGCRKRLLWVYTSLKFYMSAWCAAASVG